MLLVAVAVRARVWSADDIPMVHLQDWNRYVCDPDGLLSSAARDSSDIYLRKLHVECGVQTVFIVVDNVRNADCFRMAQDVGNRYGVGTSKDRRGLVVVLAVNDRRYFLAPGKGLEGDLTDIECDAIARNAIVSNMQQNDVDRAVLATTKALYSKLKTGSTGYERRQSEEDMGMEDWIELIFILLIFFGIPLWKLVQLLLVRFGIMDEPEKVKKKRRGDDDDWFPPFIFGGGGGLRGGSSGGSFGGSFGGGSFGGGGAGGGW